MATYFQGAVKSGDGFSETTIGSNTTAYATVTSVGQPTAGQVRVTVLYTGGDA